YNAELYGNEVDGSSAIVTTEVRDIVESMMPSLMRIFMSGDRVAQFDPTGPGHEAFADQATDYANYIFTKVRVTRSFCPQRAEIYTIFQVSQSALANRAAAGILSVR